MKISNRLWILISYLQRMSRSLDFRGLGVRIYRQGKVTKFYSAACAFKFDNKDANSDKLVHERDMWGCCVVLVVLVVFGLYDLVDYNVHAHDDWIETSMKLYNM